MSKPKLIPKRCDSCELLRINGIVCHEIGCPNMGARWEDGEWVKYYECWNCGCDVKRGESCDCMEVYEDDSDAEIVEPKDDDATVSRWLAHIRGEKTRA